MNRKYNTSLICFLFTSLLLVVKGNAQDLKLEGTYQGKNLFIMNPSTGGGSFCITDVKVNGTTSNDQIHSNAFEINLKVFEFKIGEKVQISISHKEGCMPKILNPEVLDSKSSFTVSAMKVDPKTNSLSFTTTGETGILPFIVEQFRWNKWVKIAEIKGKGTATASYQTVVSLCSGDNQFRVRQTDFTKVPRISKVTKIRSMSPPVSYTPVKKITNEIIFSDVTMYEVYDAFGKLQMKGIANKIDISSLKKSDKQKYILLFDNQEVQFVKE
jgi:hypothetical protein